MEFISITGAPEQFTSSGSSAHRGSFAAVGGGDVFENQLMSGSTTSLLSVVSQQPQTTAASTAAHSNGFSSAVPSSYHTTMHHAALHHTNPNHMYPPMSVASAAAPAPQWLMPPSPGLMQPHPHMQPHTLASQSQGAPQFVLVPWNLQQPPSVSPLTSSLQSSPLPFLVAANGTPVPHQAVSSPPMMPPSPSFSMQWMGAPSPTSAPPTMGDGHFVAQASAPPPPQLPPPSAQGSVVSGTAAHPGIHDSVGPLVVGGRLRHGSNVHTELKHVCKYMSYRDGDAVMKQLSAAPSNGPRDQVLPLFVQMFPSEHKDQAAALFERVMLLVCGPGAGRVVGIESRSETSFIVMVRTGFVWHVLYNLHYRVLMDRHGFWYAENINQYAQLKEYCDRVRALPQQTRRSKTDGLPSMPLVVELSRTVSRTTILAPPAPAPFDVLMSVNSATAAGGNASSTINAASPLVATEIC